MTIFLLPFYGIYPGFSKVAVMILSVLISRLIEARAIPCPGEIRPTVIDKIQPIELIGSKLRDRIYVVVEAVDFNLQLLYTLNL